MSAEGQEGSSFWEYQKKSVIREQRRGAPVEVIIEASLDHPNVGVMVTQQDRAGRDLSIARGDERTQGPFAEAHVVALEFCRPVLPEAELNPAAGGPAGPRCAKGLSQDRYGRSSRGV